MKNVKEAFFFAFIMLFFNICLEKTKESETKQVMFENWTCCFGESGVSSSAKSYVPKTFISINDSDYVISCNSLKLLGFMFTESPDV